MPTPKLSKMDSPKITYKYYSNPAFCAQSEVVFTQQSPCVSSRVISSSNVADMRRFPPLGANSPRKTPSNFEITKSNNNNRIIKTDISENPLRMTPSNNLNSPLRYVRTRQENIPDLPPKPGPKPKLTRSDTNSQIALQRHGSSKMRRSVRVAKEIRIVRTRSKSVDLEMAEMNRFRNNSVVSYDESDDADQVNTSRISSKHRYEEIPDDVDDLEEYTPSKKRIVESEAEEYNVDAPDENEYKEIPTQIIKTVNGKALRYAIVPSDDEETTDSDNLSKQKTMNLSNCTIKPNVTFTSPVMTQKNLIATQKLHELLSTPRKSPNLKSAVSFVDLSSRSHHRQVGTPPNNSSPRQNQFTLTPSKRLTSTPKKGITPSKSCVNLNISQTSPRRPLVSPISPRAQQKLNYGLTDIELMSSRFSPKKSPPVNVTVNPQFYTRDYRNDFDDREDFDRERIFNRSRDSERDRRLRDSQKRHVMDKTTAVITPRLAKLSAAVESIYSDDSTAYKSSWSSLKPSSVGDATLAIAALMLTICGGLTAGLSFYMMYNSGRKYYLDFGVLSGFTCLLLGLLGFRSRRYQLLPNRNYISGYVLLSAFSLLSCVGLLILLTMQPKSGTPLNDITSGAVCGLSAISLCIASLGVVTSYCCKQPPPDNRVATVDRRYSRDRW